MKAKGAALVDSLSMYSHLWHSSRSSAKQRLITAPGDALVTAAAVCYLGPLVPAAREELFSDWLRVCDGTTREPQRLLSLSSMILDDTRNATKYVEQNSTGEYQLEVMLSRGTCSFCFRILYTESSISPLWYISRVGSHNVSSFPWSFIAVITGMERKFTSLLVSCRVTSLGSLQMLYLSVQ